MNIIVDELAVNYHLSGSGKLVVLLHGWGDSSKGLAELQTNIAKNYQVLSIDLPGSGGTQAPLQTWNLDNYAEFVQKVLTKLKHSDVYAIIGHSNGGAIAIRGVSLGILKPQNIILLAAAGIRNKDSAKKLSLNVLAKAGSAATIWLPKQKRQKIREKFYGQIGSDLLVVPGLEETFKKTVAQDVQEDAKNITVPTLLIYARHDSATPVEYGQIYKNLIKGSTLVVIEDAGHFIHVDQPTEVQQYIMEFLK